MSAGAPRTVGLGVCGLGRAFVLTLPTLRADPRFALTGAADPRAEARERFSAEFGAPAHADLDALCANPAVDAVYVASPHGLHADHAVLAARAGKHLLVEKPLAVTLEEGLAIVDAARASRVHLVVGPSHAFDAPVRRAHALIAGGAFGRLRIIHAMNYTDFLYRPRRSEELDTARGGGVVLSQGAHQVDVARLLAGGLVRSVHARTGAWDPARAAEGAYTATLDFEGGAYACLSYSGYGHFDSDELCGWVGELGAAKDPGAYGGARRALAGAASPQAEASLKRARTYGGASASGHAAPLAGHEHFGLVVASCEHADLRPIPDGVMIYGDETRRLDPLPPPEIPRRAVMDELYAAVVDGARPTHDGPWGLATLEVCLGILCSARDGGAVEMRHQVSIT